MVERGISIWFFIGLCLLVMGGLICGTGIYEFILPPPVEHRVVLYGLHANVWWGGLMFALGTFYCLHFRPRRGNAPRSRHSQRQPVATSRDNHRLSFLGSVMK